MIPWTYAYDTKQEFQILANAAVMTMIKVPAELAHEIDRLAGARKRSAYAIDVLWREIRHHRQREALRASVGSWKVENHAELARGGAAHVEEIRAERDNRFED